MALPTPQISPTGFGARKEIASPRPITEKPRGFSRSDAIFARNLLKERPIETVMPISFSMRRRKASEAHRGRRMMQAFGAGEIEKGLVDRDRFDQRRQFEHEGANVAPDRRVFLHVRRDDHRVGTRLEGLEHGHGRAHAAYPGDVAGGRDDAATTAADDDRAVGERRIVALLDRGVERIAVEMGDRERRQFGMVEEARAAAGPTGAGARRCGLEAVAAEAARGSIALLRHSLAPPACTGRPF